MRTVENLLQSVLRVDLDYLIPLSLIDSRQDFIDLQQSQLASGHRQDGKPIFNIKTGSANYSPAYAKKKGKTAPIDLHDKGDFYAGIFVKIEGVETFTVDSSDSKSGILQDRYSTQIFGLDDDSKNTFIPIAKQNLLLEVQKVLG